MERYKWNICDLKEQKKNLQIQLDNEPFGTKKYKRLDTENDALDAILHNGNFTLEKYKLPYLFMSKKEIIKDICETIEYLLTDYEKHIFNTTYDIIGNIELERSKEPFNNKMYIDEQIDFIKRNLHFNNNKLKSINDFMLNPKNNILQVVKSKGENWFYCYKDGYINNSNNEDTKSLISLAHEIGHYDEHILTNKRIIKLTHHNLVGPIHQYEEVYSIFYELVSTYLLYKENRLTIIEMNENFKNIFESNTIDAHKIITAILISKDPYLDFKELMHYKFSKKFNDENQTYYYFSYLIASNLFEQYLEDEEKAFYHLNYIINNILPNNEESILNYTKTNPENLTLTLKHIDRFKKRDN